MFFTLEYSLADVDRRLRQIGMSISDLGSGLTCDISDAINADYIVAQLDGVDPGTIAVVDYLQLLDQRRCNPALADQIATLKAFACRTEVIVVLISQIDRSYDARQKRLPDLCDIRQPNPLDLTLFDKVCFLHGGEVKMRAVA